MGLWFEKYHTLYLTNSPKYDTLFGTKMFDKRVLIMSHRFHRSACQCSTRVESRFTYYSAYCSAYVVSMDCLVVSILSM